MIQGPLILKRVVLPTSELAIVVEKAGIALFPCCQWLFCLEISALWRNCTERMIVCMNFRLLSTA